MESEKDRKIYNFIACAFIGSVLSDLVTGTMMIAHNKQIPLWVDLFMWTMITVSLFRLYEQSQSKECKGN
jgi:uncharacterized protein (DUF983 family)